MSEELTPPRFPTMLRKMWSGGEVQAWIDENWNRRAQPAAPAEQEISAEEKFCDGHCSWAEHHPDCSLAAPPAQPVAHLWQHRETGRTRIVMPDQVFTTDANWLLVGPMYLHPAAAPAAYLTDCPTSASAIDAERTKASEDMRLYGIGFTVNGWHVPAPLVSICKTPDAAPSVAPEPPRRRPVGYSVTGIADLRDAKWLDPECADFGVCQSLKFKAACPPRAPLTEEFWLMLDTALDALKYHQEQTRPIELTRVTIAAVETFISAHGIGGK